MDQITFLNIGYFFILLRDLISGDGSRDVPEVVFSFWSGFKIASTLITLILLTGIFYSLFRMWQIRRDERKEFYQEAMKAEQAQSSGEVEAKESNRVQWEQILAHLGSGNQNDWRLAIIEADIILDEIVTRAGYHGDSLGEKLKTVERSDFNTIENAWEAHKVRNRIAHEGTNYSLSHDEARRTVANYQRVFEEFQFI